MLDATRHSADTEEAAATPTPPVKTTFPNGRMTSKEAWVYCSALCKAANLAPPTLRSFKWYLKHDSAMKSDLVADPFGGAEPVHSIAVGAVLAFVERLRSGDLPTAAVPSEEQQRDAERPVAVQRPSVTETQPVVCRPASRVLSVASGVKIRKQRERDAREALQYLHAKVGRGCELNQTTFGFYLAYDLIPSQFKGRQRTVQQADLDAYLELAPDGIYANQLVYSTDMVPSRGDLTMQEAYAYYASVDPNPIALNSFRSLVAAGIIQPIRTANDPKAPVLGFLKQEINAFLALRQRILEQNRDLPTTKSFLSRKAAQAAEERDAVNPVVAQVMAEAVERALPRLETARAAGGVADQGSTSEVAPPEPTAAVEDFGAGAEWFPKLSRGPFEDDDPVSNTPSHEHEIAPASRWVTVSDAYAYYRQQVPSPLSLSWFRAKIYGKSGLFRTRVEKGPQAPGLPGNTHRVDLDSIDSYVATSREADARITLEEAPVTQESLSAEEHAAPQDPCSWPVEKAYYKFRRRVPPSLSLLQFKRLVRENAIPSTVIGEVVHVSEDAVEEHFRGHPDLDPQRPLPIGTAYSYYCSSCPDPVTPSHFKRWVTSGRLAGGEEDEEGLWGVSMERVDAFLSENPSGRLPMGRPAAAQEVPAPSTAGRVILSISHYPTPEAMKEALSLLTAQGFEVEVKP